MLKVIVMNPPTEEQKEQIYQNLEKLYTYVEEEENQLNVWCNLGVKVLKKAINYTKFIKV